MMKWVRKRLPAALIVDERARHRCHFDADRWIQEKILREPPPPQMTTFLTADLQFSSSLVSHSLLYYYSLMTIVDNWWLGTQIQQLLSWPNLTECLGCFFFVFFICFVFLLFSVWSVVCRHSGLVVQFTRNSNNAENSFVFILLFVFRFPFYFTLCFSLSLSPSAGDLISMVTIFTSSSGVCVWQLSRSLSLSVCVSFARSLALSPFAARKRKTGVINAQQAVFRVSPSRRVVGQRPRSLARRLQSGSAAESSTARPVGFSFLFFACLFLVSFSFLFLS